MIINKNKTIQESGAKGMSQLKESGDYPLNKVYLPMLRSTHNT